VSRSVNLDDARDRVCFDEHAPKFCSSERRLSRTMRGRSLYAAGTTAASLIHSPARAKRRPRSSNPRHFARRTSSCDHLCAMQPRLVALIARANGTLLHSNDLRSRCRFNPLIVAISSQQGRPPSGQQWLTIAPLAC
jgi:hypothetical protein